MTMTVLICYVMVFFIFFVSYGLCFDLFLTFPGRVFSYSTFHLVYTCSRILHPQLRPLIIADCLAPARFITFDTIRHADEGS